MDEIKMERRDKERLVSLRAPNKDVTYYYTPDSYKHALVLNCACLTAKCTACLWVAHNTSLFEDAKERSGISCCSFQKKKKNAHCILSVFVRHLSVCPWGLLLQQSGNYSDNA